MNCIIAGVSKTVETYYIVLNVRVSLTIFINHWGSSSHTSYAIDIFEHSKQMKPPAKHQNITTTEYVQKHHRPNRDSPVPG